MEQAEQRRIDAFREVAREVRSNSVVIGGRTIKHRVDRSSGAIEVQLLPAEPFMALCTSVRKVYMENGPAHFYNVNNIVRRYDTGDYHKRAAAERAKYKLILRGTQVEVRIHEKRVDHEEIFKAWLNGHAFHQDAYAESPSDGVDYAQLKATVGPVADSIVQKVAYQLGGCILDMDDVLADWLGVERLPRIPPRTAPTP